MPNAIRVHQPGGPEALQLGSGRGRRARPRPGPHRASAPSASTSSTSITAPASIRSRCRSSPASRARAWSRRSARASTDVAVGDRVAYAGPIGGYAEARLIDADRLVKLPDDIGFDQAAAMMLQGMTAQMLLRSVYAGAAGRHDPGPRRGRRRRADPVPMGRGARRDRHRHGVDRGQGRARRAPTAATIRSSTTQQDFVAEVDAHHRRREAAGGL